MARQPAGWLPLPLAWPGGSLCASWPPVIRAAVTAGEW